jgi:ribosomal protein S18 acetylase RimI-like enzyme
LRYSKVPFELAGDARPRRVGVPSGAAIAPASHDAIIEIMAAVLPTSLDPADRRAAELHGPDGAAARLLDLASVGFRWEPEWWQIVIVGGSPAGCVLPVVFDEAGEDGGDEGTIFHMGVVPRFRGRRLGTLLLARGTDTLLGHGVWRVFCDTASTNAPMIEAFTNQGWTRREERDVPYWAE